MRLDDASLRRFLYRWLTSGGNRVNVAVTAAATTVSVTWDRTEPDAVYGIIATPSWATGTGVTAKTTTGCTITFTVAAPVGATVDIATFRSE